MATKSGNFQFYLDAANDKFFGTRAEGTWRAGNQETEGYGGRWKLRKKGFKRVCLSQDNFHKAASRGDLPYLKLCLQSGMLINRQEGNGWTALHLAAHQGKINAVRFNASKLRHKLMIIL